MTVVIVDEQIQLMMKHNEELPDIEKLSRHEFDLDIDEQTRLQAEGEAEVERVSWAQCSDGWNAACEGGVLNWTNDNSSEDGSKTLSQYVHSSWLFHMNWWVRLTVALGWIVFEGACT